MIRYLIHGLGQVNAKFTDFGIIPFTSEITNWDAFPKSEVFVYTSTKGLKVLTSDINPTDIFVGANDALAKELILRLRAGIYYDEQKFDMSNYISLLKRDLLNGDGEVCTLEDVLDKKFTRDVFIKPGKDLKLFNGEVLQAGVTLNDHLKTITVDSKFESSLKDKVVIAPLKEIYAEWRFFVVNGKVITGSQYKKYGRVKYDKRVPNYVVEAAKNLAMLYKPAKAYTLDLAMTSNLDLKIVEYNCINCSGLYLADVGNLAWALRKI